MFTHMYASLSAAAADPGVCAAAASAGAADADAADADDDDEVAAATLRIMMSPIDNSSPILGNEFMVHGMPSMKIHQCKLICPRPRYTPLPSASLHIVASWCRGRAICC